MSKNAALEGALGGLHSLVAQVLTAQVGQKITVPVFDSEGDILLDDNDEPVTREVYEASPQLLATAIKFLKDNEITATAEQSESVANLEDEVAARRERNRERKAKIAAQRDAANKQINT